MRRFSLECPHDLEENNLARILLTNPGIEHLNLSWFVGVTANGFALILVLRRLRRLVMPHGRPLKEETLDKLVSVAELRHLDTSSCKFSLEDVRCMPCFKNPRSLRMGFEFLTTPEYQL